MPVNLQTHLDEENKYRPGPWSQKTDGSVGMGVLQGSVEAESLSVKGHTTADGQRPGRLWKDDRLNTCMLVFCAPR